MEKKVAIHFRGNCFERDSTDHIRGFPVNFRIRTF
jgi:hypothetical protein